MANIFKGTTFNQNLNNWTPYKLLYPKNIFEGLNIPIPYWAEYENLKTRKHSIKKYIAECMHNELSAELNNKDIHSGKKIKI
jgi:hypothetical protein